MKNTFYIILLSSFMFISFKKDDNKNFEAKLADIQYYSVNKCNSDEHIYVMVLYEVNYKNLASLKMKHEFDGKISTCSPVIETDKKGNVVYGFCCSKNDNKTFTTKFISPKGRVSNNVFVKIDFSVAEIISGTPPLTKKID
ncbi:MAG: hypothetical protein L3J35_05550 [Bacteroidales bacterium]|nr:hypothetical protein [Bacteroidales bacterium]